MGQAGNVWEWTETASDGINNTANENRDVRSSAWMNYADQFNANSRGSDIPTEGLYVYGFRVASVPEPSALSLLAIGLGGLALVRRKK